MRNSVANTWGDMFEDIIEVFSNIRNIFTNYYQFIMFPESIWESMD